MSGIYIPGMEMPTSCPCELVGTGYDLHCSFVGGIPARVKEYYECCQNGTRPSWCPLVPVSEHGRLGDLDELLDRAFGCLDEETFLAFQFLVNGSVTIIPADKEAD